VSFAINERRDNVTAKTEVGCQTDLESDGSLERFSSPQGFLTRVRYHVPNLASKILAICPVAAMMNLRENEPQGDDTPQSDDPNPYDLPDRNPDYEDKSRDDDIYERKEQDNRTRE
jgi:hypothetical protein